MGVSLELPVAASGQGDLVLPDFWRQGVEVVGEDQLAGLVPLACLKRSSDSQLLGAIEQNLLQPFMKVFLASPAGASIQGVSAPLLGSWDTTLG